MFTARYRLDLYKKSDTDLNKTQIKITVDSYHGLLGCESVVWYV